MLKDHLRTKDRKRDGQKRKTRKITFCFRNVVSSSMFNTIDKK